MNWAWAGIGHRDRQPQLGGRTAQELVERRKRGNPSVDRLGRPAMLRHVVFHFLLLSVGDVCMG
jgi:hypothetical protein